MFYALIVVCLATVPECEPESAIWAEQSPPIFESEEECGRSAFVHLQRHLPDILAIEPDAKLQVAVTCTEVKPQRDL